MKWINNINKPALILFYINVKQQTRVKLKHNVDNMIILLTLLSEFLTVGSNNDSFISSNKFQRRKI